MLSLRENMPLGFQRLQVGAAGARPSVCCWDRWGCLSILQKVLTGLGWGDPCTGATSSWRLFLCQWASLYSCSSLWLFGWELTGMHGGRSGSELTSVWTVNIKLDNEAQHLRGLDCAPPAAHSGRTEVSVSLNWSCPSSSGLADPWLCQYMFPFHSFESPSSRKFSLPRGLFQWTSRALPVFLCCFRDTG